MFKKILIANRGEIAVRVIRACRDMGISPVAVYSEVDRGALHVRLADEAYLIGPAPSAQSYLSIEKIIDAAKRSKAEAVHPGYGFLSENSAFAQACEDAGLTFIGPSPKSIALMGSKIESRKAVARYGVPMIPGTMDPVRDEQEARRIANSIGYPVMLKASSGGGGKGLRLVQSEAEIGDALQLTRAEAQSVVRRRRGIPGEIRPTTPAYRNPGARGQTWKRRLPGRARMQYSETPPEGHRRVPLADCGFGFAAAHGRSRFAGCACCGVLQRRYCRVPRRPQADSSISWK